MSTFIKKAEVIKFENKLIKAIKTSDIEFLDTILHDSLLFIAPDGNIITKQMDLASHKSAEMIVEHLVPTFEKVSIVDNMAVVIVVYETKGTMLGKPILGKFRYIRIWKQFSDGLKVIGGSCFKI